jgi:hypothetical protein
MQLIGKDKFFDSLIWVDARHSDQLPANGV